MRFSPNQTTEFAEVLDAQEDAHWSAGQVIGSVRVELIDRNVVAQAFVSGAGELASVRLLFARCHRSSLIRPGRFLSARGRTYRIESVAEERDGLLRYQSMTLKEVQ